ncbi:MAG: putative porin, partial [Verrucomicrobiota bacterium]|nr:putative porin [Verrucomicrobiota bacterium]
NNYSIFISRAFLGWHSSDDFLTVVAGKQANPFYTTDLVWDPDINPQGLTETVKFHKLYFGGGSSGAAADYSKDGKSYAATESTIHEERPWELTLNMGEFIFDDNAEGSFDNDAATDAYLFVGQLVGSYKFGSVKLTIAPGVLFFNAADLSGLINENPFTDVTGVSGETRKLVILTAPGDVSFKLGTIPAKFYWDFAYNTQGKGRADDIYALFGFNPTTGLAESLHKSEDDFAFLVGAQIGQNKKAGDWSFTGNYRQTGIASVDPNLNDSDFALGELNTRGFKAGLGYNLTDFATINATYFYAWNLRDDLFGGLATGGTSNGGIANGNVIQIFQLDMNIKF